MNNPPTINSLTCYLIDRSARREQKLMYLERQMEESISDPWWYAVFREQYQELSRRV